MQGDNDVAQTVVPDGGALWTSTFRDELLAVIKPVWGTQTALVKHIKAVHDPRPPLSKQTLSKRLMKLDWPTAETIIECCTHGDETARTVQMARLAGIYRAATGQAPKGYCGPIEPPSAPATLPGSAQATPSATAELQQLRRSLAEARAQLDERDQLLRRELVEHDQMIDTLSQQVRMTSVAHTASRQKADAMRSQIEKLRVQLSGADARYQDQRARAEAADSRRRALWERYALLNAFQENSADGQQAIELGPLAMHRPGLSGRIEAQAPAARRVLAVYLNSYRELAETGLDAIAAATRLGGDRLTAILLARRDPTLEEALSIAAVIAAPTATIERLHTTITEAPTRPAASQAGPSFGQIVASMDSPTVTAASDDLAGDCPDDTMATPTQLPVAEPVMRRPVADKTPSDVSPAWVMATVAGDRRSRDGDASPQIARRSGVDRDAVRYLLGIVAVMVTTAAVSVAMFLTHPSLRALGTTKDVVSAAVLLGVLAGAALLGITHGTWHTIKVISRLRYRGRHARRHRRPRAVHAPVASSDTCLINTLDLSDTAHQPAAHQRLTPGEPHTPPSSSGSRPGGPLPSDVGPIHASAPVTLPSRGRVYTGPYSKPSQPGFGAPPSALPATAPDSPPTGQADTAFGINRGKLVRPYAELRPAHTLHTDAEMPHGETGWLDDLRTAKQQNGPIGPGTTPVEAHTHKNSRSGEATTPPKDDHAF